METTRDVKIPVNICVRCPMYQFKMRQARRCESCEYFGGLTQRLSRDSPPLEFFEEFQVACDHPIRRQLFEIDLVVEDKESS